MEEERRREDRKIIKTGKQLERRKKKGERIKAE